MGTTDRGPASFPQPAMSSTPRRVPSLVAGVLAMLASLTALGAVIWSDLAEASQDAAPVLEADEPAAPRPVTLQKLEYPPEPELPEFEPPPRPLKRRLFGRFEGY